VVRDSAVGRFAGDVDTTYRSLRLAVADSIQLAAALEWCEYAPQGRVFLTADQKLRDAALLSGFDAEQR
jgi:hypothetical protein